MPRTMFKCPFPFPLRFYITCLTNGFVAITLLWRLHSHISCKVMAMVLVDLKRIAEAEGGIPVTDCSISVPTYFTEAERYAMLNAAQVRVDVQKCGPDLEEGHQL